MMRTALLVIILAACGGSGSGFTNVCTGLSLGDCQLADGCKPDICAGCFCDLNYRGCIPAGNNPAECPALGCPSAICCSTDAQCQGQGVCTPPGASQGCGPCNNDPGNCTTDGECAG